MAIDRPGAAALGDGLTIGRPRPRAQHAIERLYQGSVARWGELAALVVILAATAALSLARMGNLGMGNDYYAAAVRSMLQSWHNFFFVSFDPGGFVTVDKPPLGFWIQTASAKLFGFHGWSILLPQALAGVGSVFVLYRMVRSAFGGIAGLVAGAVFALTPVAIADNRNNTIDSLLVFTLLLAAAAVLRAVSTGRLRWLLVALVLAGAGFNIKMLEAYLALPAIAAAYFFAAPGRWRARIGHLVIAGLVLAVVSLSWPLAVDLTPASARPYVGSSQHNSEIELAFGYNGIQRLLGMRPPGAPAGGPAASADRAQFQPPSAPAPDFADTPPAFGAAPGAQGFPQPRGGGSGRGFAPPAGGAPGFVEGSASALRLIDRQLGGQAGWLLPFALAGALSTVALTVCWRRWRLRHLLHVIQPSAQQAQLLFWGVWLLTGAAFFSVANFFHPYYLIMVAPPIAALTGMGFGLVLERSRRHPRAAGWLILAIALTAGTQAYLLRAYPQWSERLTLPMFALCAAAAACLIARFVVPSGRGSAWLLSSAAVVGLAGVLFVPAVWSVLTVAQGAGGGMPAGGPAVSPFPGGPPPAFAAQGSEIPGAPPFALAGRIDELPGGAPPGGFGLPGAAADQSRLLGYLSSHESGTRFVLAVPSSMEASPIIIQTGQPVMAMGGFSGGDPILTATQVAADVANGTIRFFLLPSGGAGRGLPPGGPGAPPPPGGSAPGFAAGGGPGFMFGQAGAATSWVTGHCAAVPASEWQQSSGANAGFGFGFGPGGQQLYDCAPTAQAS